jgi:hypothetical protein
MATTIVESAQAAGAWVADTAKELVDKGANLIRPSSSEDSDGSEQTAAAAESSPAAEPATATAGAEESKEPTPSGGQA